MRNNLFIIAKSGWKYIGYASLAFVLFAIFDLEFLEFFAFVAILFLIYLYRNPEKEMPFYQKNSVLAPVDGVVTSIENIEDSEYAYKIEIESSYLNIGVLRLPMSAKVDSLEIIRGSRVSKKSKLFPLLNEYAKVRFIDEHNNSIELVHRLKQSFAPIDIDLVKGQEMLQSTRYGLVINGTTSLYLKSNFRLNVKTGQEISAAETLLGYFT